MKTLAACLVALLAVGCAGARSSVVLPDSHYPVSLSSSMIGEKGETLNAGDLEKVGHYHAEKTAWGTFYSLIPFTPHLDISESVNHQVAQAGGQGIASFATESRYCGLDYFFILMIIPFWPGCANVTVDGDIVKHKAPPAMTPAAVASSTPVH